MMRGMKQRFAIKHEIGLVVLIVAVALCVVGASLAVFTSQDHQRSVVRNRDTDSIKFSSDKLYQVVDVSSPKAYYYPMEKDSTELSFTVCNFQQGKPLLYSDKTIEYNITVEIQNGTDGFSYSITRNNEILGTVQNGQSQLFGVFNLEKNESSQDQFSVKVNSGDLNNANVTVTVTPLDLKITNNRQLCAELRPIEYAHSQGVHLNTEYTDATRGYPSSFDAYNFFVEIVGGSGSVTLTWDKSKLDIDPYFKAKVKASGEAGSYTFNMKSEDASAAYMIPFYRHAGCTESFDDWNSLGISAELEPSNTASNDE